MERTLHTLCHTLDILYGELLLWNEQDKRKEIDDGGQWGGEETAMNVPHSTALSCHKRCNAC